MLLMRRFTPDIDRSRSFYALYFRFEFTFYFFQKFAVNSDSSDILIMLRVKKLDVLSFLICCSYISFS